MVLGAFYPLSSSPILWYSELSNFAPFFIFIVTIQDCSPPAAAHPGLEWLRAGPPQAASSQEEESPE